MQNVELIPGQLAEIAEAGEILGGHATFGLDTGQRCRNCMQNNQCADLNGAIAIYNRYHVVPQRPRRSPRAALGSDDVVMIGYVSLRTTSLSCPYLLVVSAAQLAAEAGLRPG